jgi:hypothetical protein
MIRHDDELVSVELYFFPHGRGVKPFCVSDLALSRPVYLPVAECAKDFGALVRDQCDKVRARLGVVIAFQPDGAAVMAVGIVRHIIPVDSKPQLPLLALGLLDLLGFLEGARAGSAGYRHKRGYSL